MQVVHTFAKNKREVVRASLDVYEGRPVAALWVCVPEKSGEMTPTRKGLVVSRDALPELEEAVRQLRAAAAEEA